MNCSRTDVSDQHFPILGDFTLDVDVPIHDIRAAWILLDVAVPDIVRIETHVRIDTTTQMPSGVSPHDLERSSRRGVQAELIRKGQNIEDAKTAANPVSYSIIARNLTKCSALNVQRALCLEFLEKSCLYSKHQPTGVPIL